MDDAVLVKQGAFSIAEIIREDAGPEWTVRYGEGKAVHITQNDILHGRVKIILAPDDNHTITIEGSRIVISTDQETLEAFQRWAGINVELPYKAIARSDGIYTIVAPDGCEGLQPTVTFTSNQVGTKIRLRQGDKHTYKISVDGRVIVLTGPQDLIVALRNGTLEATPAS